MRKSLCVVFIAESLSNYSFNEYSVSQTINCKWDSQFKLESKYPVSLKQRTKRNKTSRVVPLGSAVLTPKAVSNFIEGFMRL